jgi:hypothetical protein
MNSSILEWNSHKVPKLKLTNKEQTLFNTLLIFYSTPEYIPEILPIILGCSNVSLRILDWFVTNYSKKSNVIYDISVDKQMTSFNVHKAYKTQLKAYSKKLFDPFCRGDPKIPFQYDKENIVNTTIGQLNFFKWALSNNILNYVKHHLNDIDNDMNKNKNFNGKKKKKIMKSSDLSFDDDNSSSLNVSETNESSEIKKTSKEIIVFFG